MSAGARNGITLRGHPSVRHQLDRTGRGLGWFVGCEGRIRSDVRLHARARAHILRQIINQDKSATPPTPLKERERGREARPNVILASSVVFAMIFCLHRCLFLFLFSSLSRSGGGKGRGSGAQNGETENAVFETESAVFLAVH